MKNIILWCGTLIAVSAWGAAAHGALLGSLNYVLDASAADTSLLPGAEFQHNFDMVNNEIPGNSIIIHAVANADKGGASAGAQVDGAVSPGRLSLFALARANAQNEAGHGLNTTGSQATATVSAFFADTVFIGLPLHTPEHALVVESELLLNVDMPASVTAVPTSNQNMQRDWVEAHVQEVLQLTLTTGILQHGPLPHGDDIFAFRDISAQLGGTFEEIQPANTPIPALFVIGIDGIMKLGLGMTAQVSLSVNNHDVTNFSPGAAGGFVDASHTLRWGGIKKITDMVTGQEITDYTLTSDSGFDYRFAAPVPEPTSLVLTGVLLLLCHRLRERVATGHSAARYT